MKTVAVITPFARRFELYCKQHPEDRNINAYYLEKQIGLVFDEVIVLAETDEWDSAIAEAFETAVSRKRR